MKKRNRPKQLTIFDDINHQRYLAYRDKMLPIIQEKINTGHWISTHESCLLQDYERAVSVPENWK